MSQKLTMKKINTWRQQLQEIMGTPKKQGELIPKKQIELLHKLAIDMGACVRGARFRQGEKLFTTDATVAELTANINQTLQTATFIVNCEYTRRACYITLAAVIVAILASTFSISVAKKANKITHDILELQRNEFTLRNRPWITIAQYSFGSKGEDRNGKEYPHSIILRLQNISEVPANNVFYSYKIWSKDKKVLDSGNSAYAAIAKGNDQTGKILLNDDMYSKIKSGENFPEVFIEVTYSGVLSEQEEIGKTSLVFYYAKTEDEFKNKSQEYK